MSCCSACAARDARNDELALETFERESEVIGGDTRVRVRNTTRAPFRFICNLEYDSAPICSGTLIGPRTLLTAGHCISGLIARRMRVIPGRNGTLEPLPATRASALIAFPRFAPATESDIAIIHLVDPIGDAVGYWTNAHALHPGDGIGTSILAGDLPLPAGTLPVNVCGYPGDKPGGGTVQYRAYNLSVRRVGRMLHHVADTYPGHSGSPVWVRRDASRGGRVLIGVHVAGDDPRYRGKANRAVLIDNNIRRFIIANMK